MAPPPFPPSHPDSELPDVGSLLQGRGGLFFGQFGDEVLGVVGGLRLHGGADRSGHAACLLRRRRRRVVDGPQSHVVAGFLLRSEGVLVGDLGAE